MKIERPDYYSKFTCTADKCGDTCCRGWEVDIDDDANEYYQLAPGEFAKEVRASIREEETEDGHARFFPLTADGNCPFLDRTGLCRIILQMGEGALCTTCREYPRYYIEAGDYSQQDLSLSCPAVAEIFFAEDGPISYTLTENEGAEDAEFFGGDSSDACAGNKFCACDGSAGNKFCACGGSAGNSFCACDGSGDSDCGGACDGTLSRDEKQRLQTILAARDQKVKDIQSKPFAWELAAPRRRAAAGAFAAALGTDSGAAGEMDMALLSALQRCEPIGAGWSEQLSMLQQLIQDESHLDTLTGEFIACAGEKAQGWFRRLQVYFLWRYSIDEWFEERETAEVLCRRSLRAVFLLCLLRFETKGQFDAEDMADIAHSYSREIEHDEKNLEIMKGAS